MWRISSLKARLNQRLSRSKPRSVWRRSCSTLSLAHNDKLLRLKRALRLVLMVLTLVLRGIEPSMEEKLALRSIWLPMREPSVEVRSRGLAFLAGLVVSKACVLLPRVKVPLLDSRDFGRTSKGAPKLGRASFAPAMLSLGEGGRLLTKASWATEVGVVVTGDAAATTGTTPGTPGTVGTAPRQGEKASCVGKEGGLMACGEDDKLGTDEMNVSFGLPALAGLAALVMLMGLMAAPP